MDIHPLPLSRRTLLLLLTSAAVLWPGVGRAGGDRPAGSATTPRVLIISVDGMRADLMLRSEAPHIRALFRGGAYSFWARTVPHAITLPSHVSMLTGVIPRKHEIEWNIDLPLKEPVYPKYPSLFELAKKAGYTTALAAGKSKFDLFNKPGTLDHFTVPATVKGEDADVRDSAVAMIRDYKPEVMFVHFPTTDNVGHKLGWGTDEQIAAIEAADACVGAVLKALDDAGVREQTTILLTADHGGAGLTHLADDARARHIPWILNGPGVRKNFDLTRLAKVEIDTEDTFATACKVLGLTPEKPVDGKPILEAMEQPGEMLKAARANGGEVK
jgi:predicted AlkP superfamily pyrophosphatase or phosphodiesterase